ncbi:MAG: hypothetical protein AAGI52_12205 [Bacteroidota bacterium]
MALDRRRVVHQVTSNVLQTLASTKTAIDTQISSGSLTGWTNVSANVTSIQTMLIAEYPPLLTWYNTWRGKEAPEPPAPDFPGVFGTFAQYETNLKVTTDIVRLARNDYAAMSLIAMAYEELYSVGLALDATAPGLKEIALGGLGACVPIIESLSETVCVATIRALHNEDSTIPMSLAATAVANTQSAWASS